MSIRTQIASIVLAAAATFQLGAAANAGSLEYQPIPAASPKPLPAKGPTTREEMEGFIDGFMASQLKKGPVAGATVAVVKDGALFFSKGYGYADIEKRVPVDPATTLFRPGSVSKLFTWTAVMQLVEQGKLDLDTDINQYLKDIKVPATYPEPITLRNVMTHTTGFEDGGLGYLMAQDAAHLIPLHDWLKKHMPDRVMPPARDFSNGVTAAYSNYATALTGDIIATVSGMPFDDYIDQHVFRPLGMTRSTFREPLPAALAPHMSKGYMAEDGSFTPKSFEFIHIAGPAGSLSSPAEDMAKFMLAYLQHGALDECHRILKPETVALMHTRAMSRDPVLNGHALGFSEIFINGHRIVGHGGDTVFFHSMLSLLPEANLGMFISVNTGGEGARTAMDFEQAFFKHYFPADLPKLKIRADAKERNARYAGEYRGSRRSFTAWEKAFNFGGDDKVIPMPDGTLQLAMLGKPARWIEVGDGVFRAENDDEFIAFKKGPHSDSDYLALPFPPMTSERVSWWETSGVQTAIGGIALLLFVLMIISAIRNWRADRAGPQNLRWARVTLALSGVLLIGFIILAIAALSSGVEKLIYEVPTTMYVALAFPLIALIPTLGALYFMFVAWKSGGWRVGSRIFYSLTVLFLLGFLWMLNYWNLLGYHFN